MSFIMVCKYKNLNAWSNSVQNSHKGFEIALDGCWHHKVITVCVCEQFQSILNQALPYSV